MSDGRKVSGNFIYLSYLEHLYYRDQTHFLFRVWSRRRKETSTLSWRRGRKSQL